MEDELHDRQVSDPKVQAWIEDFRRRVREGTAKRGMTAEDLLLNEPPKE